MVDAQTKKEILGKVGKILVGGSIPAEDRVEKPKFDGDKEPVAWHFSSEQLFDEILHSFAPKAVINATGLDHVLCLSCVKAKIPVVSFVLTEEHQQHLESHIKKRLWSLYLDENSSVYQPNLFATQRLFHFLVLLLYSL